MLNIFSIFKNEESLFSEFIPPELLFRDEEIKQLAINYRSVVRSENLVNGNHVGSKSIVKSATPSAGK